MKHLFQDRLVSHSKIEKKNPLKQGLKLIIIIPKSFENHIEKKNPLKQGLKPEAACDSNPWPCIEKKNPLKQGLKPIIGSPP